MVPPFTASGNLPPGVHWATWDEVAQRFGTTPYRVRLVEGLKLALQSLARAGCRTVYIATGEAKGIVAIALQKVSP